MKNVYKNFSPIELDVYNDIYPRLCILQRLFSDDELIEEGKRFEQREKDVEARMASSKMSKLEMRRQKERTRKTSVASSGYEESEIAFEHATKIVGEIEEKPIV